MTRVRHAVPLFAAMAVLAAACGSEQRPEVEEDEQPGPEPAAEPASEAPTAPEPEAAPTEVLEPSCDDLVGLATAYIAAVTDAHAACTFDNDCVAQSVRTDCYAPCDVALHPRGVVALEAAAAGVAERQCPLFGGLECPPVTPECARSTPRCAEGRCMMDEGDAPLRETPVPAENARSLSDNPPPRPPPGEAEQERGQRLFDAIVHDDPARIGDFFFPREAFAVVKAIADPDGYWQRLFRRFGRDMHELHETLVEEHGDLSGLRFDRLDIIRRGGWVPLREEGNALPYWVSRHSQLYYTVGREDGQAGEERHFEVRVLITWGERWYVTHLKEFH